MTPDLTRQTSLALLRAGIEKQRRINEAAKAVAAEAIPEPPTLGTPPGPSATPSAPSTTGTGS